MSDTTEWKVVKREVCATGTYFYLNVVSGASQPVTVKARTLPGAAYVCLSCRANFCEHVRFVQDTDTPDAGEVGAA